MYRKPVFRGSSIMKGQQLGSLLLKQNGWKEKGGSCGGDGDDAFVVMANVYRMQIINRPSRLYVLSYIILTQPYEAGIIISPFQR